MIPIKRSLHPFLSDFCALTIIKTYIVCVKGTTSRSAWRSGRARTRGSPASTTSCWPCSPPSSASPWRGGHPSCTGWGKNLDHFEGSHKYIALFHFDFVPLLCFVPSLIHQVEEVVPVYLQLWPTNPERENCLSLKEQILATFSFFSADKYILLCSCLTQCQYSNFCISENPITYIKSPLCTKFRGFTE